MNTYWEQEGERMRLLVDGHPSSTVIELDGDRWKATLPTPASQAWFTSLKDARTAAERCTRAQIPLDVLSRL